LHLPSFTGGAPPGITGSPSLKPPASVPVKSGGSVSTNPPAVPPPPAVDAPAIGTGMITVPALPPVADDPALLVPALPAMTAPVPALPAVELVPPVSKPPAVEGGGLSQPVKAAVTRTNTFADRRIASTEPHRGARIAYARAQGHGAYGAQGAPQPTE
jgi:hypothetical protein